MMPTLDEKFDYDRTIYSVDDYAARDFMESIIEAAKTVPMIVFMDDTKLDDPIIALARKLFEDSYGEEINQWQ